MFKRAFITGCLCAALVSAAVAQGKRPAGTKSVMYGLTVTADTVYSGTMEMAVEGGKVTGSMHVTSPTEITGKLAGTAKAGVLSLEFPFHMVEENCEGNVKMNIKLPAKPGPAAGTMEAVGCDGDETNKVTGIVELKPLEAKKTK